MSSATEHGALAMKLSDPGSAAWAIGLSQAAGVKYRKARIYAGLDKGTLTPLTRSMCDGAVKRWTLRVPLGIGLTSLTRLFIRYRAIAVSSPDSAMPWTVGAACARAGRSPVVLDALSVGANHATLAGALDVSCGGLGQSMSPMTLLKALEAPVPLRIAIVLRAATGPESMAYAADLVRYVVRDDADIMRVVVVSEGKWKASDGDDAAVLAGLVRLTHDG